MPVNRLTLLSVDTETTGLKVGVAEVCQLAAVAYDGATLEPIGEEEGGTFNSLMRPLKPENIDDKALQVNGLTREQLARAPDQKATWLSFVRWVANFNQKGGVNGKPILVGKNVRNFDVPFLEALNQLHGPGKQLFNPRFTLDLEDFLFHWFSADASLENYRLDTVRDYMGMTKAGAHTALVDARQTGDLVCRFLKLNRRLREMKGKDGPFIKFKDCCRE